MPLASDNSSHGAWRRTRRFDNQGWRMNQDVMVDQVNKVAMAICVIAGMAMAFAAAYAAFGQ
jgi:hypothetical protein